MQEYLPEWQKEAEVIYARAGTLTLGVKTGEKEKIAQQVQAKTLVMGAV